MLIKKIKFLAHQLHSIAQTVKHNKNTLENIQHSLGRIEARQISMLQEESFKNIVYSEFKVFSQWGEDGIIHHLISQVKIPKKIFVEFGVENYTESNTRFLLINKNWSGLVIDGNKNHIDYIKNDPIYWRYNLKAVNSFLTRENINSLLSENGVQGEIGILSIDIDGNDYWVWKAIDVISPAIVIVEYNFRFGIEKALTIPYQEYFVRSESHYSMIYYGASLKSLCLLGKRKGYAFVGCNSAGNNAFFVRCDLKPDTVKELSVEEGYVEGKFRESRNQEGNLAFLSLEEEKSILASLPLIDVESGKS